MPVLILDMFWIELRGFPEGLNMNVWEKKKLQMNPSLFGWAIRKADLPSNGLRKSMGATKALEKGKDYFDMVSVKYILLEMLGWHLLFWSSRGIIAKKYKYESHWHIVVFKDKFPLKENGYKWHHSVIRLIPMFKKL